MTKRKYYAARSFADGQHHYGAGAPVPIRAAGEGPECGIRENQVENLIRLGLLEERDYVQSPPVEPEKTPEPESGQEPKAKQPDPAPSKAGPKSKAKGKSNSK